jgi:hypothetical protein
MCSPDRLAARPPKILQAVSAGIDVHRDRLGDRLAGVQDLEPGQLVAARAQEVGGAPEHAAARRAGHARPLREARLRRLHGAIDVPGIGFVDGREGPAGRRIDRLEGPARARLGILAADVELQVFQTFAHFRISIRPTVPKMVTTVCTIAITVIQALTSLSAASSRERGGGRS